MRRALVGLAVTALAVLAFAGPAGAATVTQLHFSGTGASAFWSDSTTGTDTVVDVERTNQGFEELLAAQTVCSFDSSGNCFDWTFTSADVTSGFSFTFQRPLASASVSGLGLPAQACTVVHNVVIGCTPTTIDVTVAWTGQGPITRGVQNGHFKTDGFSETFYFSGSTRDAPASGTFNGSTLTAGEPPQQGGFLADTVGGTVTVCIGTSC
jgi:hypothetical protein